MGQGQGVKSRCSGLLCFLSGVTTNFRLDENHSEKSRQARDGDRYPQVHLQVTQANERHLVLYVSVYCNHLIHPINRKEIPQKVDLKRWLESHSSRSPH